MIRISRPFTAIPAAWKVRAATETDAAIAAYKAAVKKQRASRRKRPLLEFKFKYEVYGDDALREQLNEYYRWKCAYCETFFGATQPVAVEHYRPKKEIVEGAVRIKPGYYWLAAEWSNLLPSCTDCNSPRRQTAADGTRSVRGKGNFFPLAKGSKRATKPGAEKREVALLLHPEKDVPEKHLEFLVPRDRVGVIRPALIRGKPSDKGAASIHVYALDRPQLVMNRQNFGLRMHMHLQNTRQWLREARAHPNDLSKRQNFRDNVAELRRMLEPGQPYLAMTRAILKAEFPEHARLL